MFRFLVFSIFLWPIFGQANAQQSAIGRVLKAEQTAYVERGGQAVRLVQGAELFTRDVVATSEGGLVLIRFNDETKIAVGPNSRLELNDITMHQNRAASSFAVTAVAGAFRFISGETPKENYSLTTPVSTIGVRGTVFDLHASETRFDILLLQGRIRYCLQNGECSQLDAFCTIVSAMRLDGLTRPQTVEDRNAIIREYFPFIRNQSRLIRNFRQNLRQCGQG